MSTDDHTDSPFKGSEIPISAIQADVGFGIQFRLELMKQLLTLATALLAFTVGFFTVPGAPGHVDNAPLAWVGWMALIVAIGCGLLQMRHWERFYLSYRDFDHKDDGAGGKTYRATITRYRHLAMTIQYITLTIGVLCLTVFAALRIRG